jgi:SSS family solute:Na+ symporter
MMTPLDWTIAGSLLVGLIAVAVYLGRLNKSVADFVLAGRRVRKYLGMSAGTAEGLGLASIAASLQQGMQNGFALVWISVVLMCYTVPVFGVIGFGIKRFRATRCMTIPQFLEQRYDRRLRLLVGLILAVSGILNMAIFPITGSYFLVAFSGMPEVLSFGPWSVSTVHLFMISLVTLAVLFTFLGGMVTVVVTDYIQATIIVGALIFVGVVTLGTLGPAAIHSTLQEQMGDAAFNPFLEGSYGLTWIIWVFLLTTVNKLAFAPAVQKMASADSPETARKMELLQSLFGMGMRIFLLLIGIGALVALGGTPPEGQSAESYFRFAGAIHLRETLPVIVMGVVFAAFLFAAISTDDSYLLAWSAVIVNDIVQPLFSKPFSPRAHIFIMRGFIVLIGLFVIVFGLTYDPRESILDYIYMTGTLIGGIGISVFTGLYWSRATTAGAVSAIVICAVIPLADLIGKQLVGDRYPLSIQQSGLLALVLSLFAIVIVSLLTGRGKVSRKWVDYGVDVRRLDAEEKRAMS